MTDYLLVLLQPHHPSVNSRQCSRGEQAPQKEACLRSFRRGKGAGHWAENECLSQPSDWWGLNAFVVARVITSLQPPPPPTHTHATQTRRWRIAAWCKQTSIHYNTRLALPFLVNRWLICSHRYLESFFSFVVGCPPVVIFEFGTLVSKLSFLFACYSRCIVFGSNEALSLFCSIPAFSVVSLFICSLIV